MRVNHQHETNNLASNSGLFGCALSAQNCAPISPEKNAKLHIGGAISDRIGRRAVLMGITLLALITTWPVMQWLTAAPDFTRMTLVLLWFSFFFGMYNGAMVAALTEVMPVYVRTVGFSLAFSLATAIFGGLTPAISTALVKLTGDKSSPGWWLMCAALCGLAATAMLFVRLSRGYIAAENKA